MSLWTETIKPDGSSSLQSHTPKTVGRWCKFEDHEVDDEFPNSRVARCKKCGKDIPLVLGFHEIKNGHILTVALKR
jgi:hypothetical protein